MKTVKIIVLAATALILILILSSCGKKDITPVTEKRIEITIESDSDQDESAEYSSEIETTDEVTTEISSTVSPDAAKAAYKQFLKSYMEEHGANEGGQDWPKFGLIYLDDDDAPELVIPKGPYHIAPCELYTFDGEKVIMVGEYGSWGSFGYYPRKGIIVGGYAGNGVVYTTYYKYQNGETEEIEEFSEELKHWEDDPNVKENWNYSVGEKQVSQEEYETAENNIMNEYGLKTGELRNSDFPYDLDDYSISLID